MTDADLELPAELDTSDPDVLATLLQRAFSGAETAEFLEALIQIGGSLPAGALGGPVPEGEYDVRLSESVCKTLRALDAKAATRTRRTKVDKALRLLREVGPSHPSLETHRYNDLDRAVGVPVWQSNAETAVPNAWRMWWWYEGGDARAIMVGAVGPHPKRSIKTLPR